MNQDPCNLEQGTVEWLEFRRNKIGASDAAAVLGISPWKTAKQLWREKMGYAEAPKISYAMQRGTDMEEEARLRYEERTGNIVFPAVESHPLYHWMIASLDGMTADGHTIVELKVPNQSVHSQALIGVVPQHYYCQLQHQMAVTGLPQADYFTWDGETGHLVTVKRDEEFIKKMIEKEMAFMECLYQEIPPPDQDEDYVDKSQDNNWAFLEQNYLEACESVERWTELKEKYRDMLIQYCNDKNVEGARLKATKVVTIGRVDYNAIPELSGVDLAKYRKPDIESYRISVKGVVHSIQHLGES